MAGGRAGIGIPPAREVPSLPYLALLRQMANVELRGRTKSEEARRKISEAARSRIYGPLTPETRVKLSEAMRRAHAERRATKALSAGQEQ